MEFPDLGKHCTVQSCKLLDFLPFRCDACKKIFCLDHRHYLSHACPMADTKDTVVPSCPLCGQMIRVYKGEDIDAKMESHISGGCKPMHEEGGKANPCSVRSCKKGELVPILCPYCHNNFCLAHRAPADHKCECEPLNVADDKAAAERKGRQSRALERIQALWQSNKSSKTKTKVKLMRLKQNATGNNSIPDDQRCYFEVVYPMDSGVHPKMLFFSRNHTLGKVLDVAAAEGSIENFNNKMGAEKLYLFSLKTGKPLPTNTKLCDLDPDTLETGDALLLEKLSNLDKDK